MTTVGIGPIEVSESAAFDDWLSDSSEVIRRHNDATRRGSVVGLHELVTAAPDW